MTFFSTHYRSGDEIRKDDRIEYAGSSGRVVFVLSHDPDDWSRTEQWYGNKFGTGFMLDVQSMGLVFMEQSDEDLKLVARVP